MQYSFELVGAGSAGCHVLIERDALAAPGDIEGGFLADARDLRRYRTHRSFGQQLSELVADPNVVTVIAIRNPRLVLDDGLADRLRTALARLRGLPLPWSIAAAGGLSADGERTCALYSSVTPFLPVEPHPLPLVDPLPDIWIADAGFLRELTADGGPLPGCGLETVIALRGWLAGRLAISLPELVAGIDGPLQARDPAKLDRALSHWLDPRLAGQSVETLMGRVDLTADPTAPPARGPDLATEIDRIIAAASDPLSLSIVTRTRFQRPHLLDRLLTSISRARTDTTDLEIVLSTDIDEDAASEHLADLRSRFVNLDLRLQVNRSPGPSRVANLLGGLRAAAKEYVAVMDDDDYIDLFAFEALARPLFLGARPLIVANSEVHAEEWAATPSGRHVLTRSEPLRTWPAHGWRTMFSGVNALPICALVAPRERLAERLDAFEFRHDLSEDYTLFLLMLTDPNLPRIAEVSGTFGHISVRGAGENSITLPDRRPWVRDIALYLSDLTQSGSVAGPGLWRLLASGRSPAETLAEKSLAECRAELARRDRQIRLMQREVTMLRARVAREEFSA